MISKIYYLFLREWHNHKANLYLRTANKSMCESEISLFMEKCAFHHDKYVNYLCK